MNPFRRKRPDLPLEDYALMRFAAPYREMLQSHRYEELELALLALPREDRDFLMGRSLFAGIDPSEWSARQPDSFFATLAGAAHLQAQASQVRGSGPASTVTPTAWNRIEVLTTRSLQSYQRARELDPTDPFPLAMSMELSLLGALTGDEVLELARTADLVAPHNYQAANSLAVCFQQKWGGDHELSFEHARVLQLAPEGSSVRGLLALAHIERWLYHLAFDRDGGADSYFDDPTVTTELKEALSTSVLSPHHRPSLATHALLNDFAFCFMQAEDKTMLRVLLERIGDDTTVFPWCYAGSTTGPVNRARRAVGLR